MPAIEIFINDIKVSCEAGMTVLEATKAAKVDLPTLCYMEGLTTVGACRLCLKAARGSSPPARCRWPPTSASRPTPRS
jgi:NADH dehydrogenase/NADH:ubiquinone oxidoreductase subunit G